MIFSTAALNTLRGLFRQIGTEEVRLQVREEGGRPRISVMPVKRGRDGKETPFRTDLWEGIPLRSLRVFSPSFLSQGHLHLAGKLVRCKEYDLGPLRYASAVQDALYAEHSLRLPWLEAEGHDGWQSDVLPWGASQGVDAQKVRRVLEQAYTLVSHETYHLLLNYRQDAPTLTLQAGSPSGRRDLPEALTYLLNREALLQLDLPEHLRPVNEQTYHQRAHWYTRLLTREVLQGLCDHPLRDLTGTLIGNHVPTATITAQMHLTLPGRPC